MFAMVNAWVNCLYLGVVNRRLIGIRNGQCKDSQWCTMFWQWNIWHQMFFATTSEGMCSIMRRGRWLSNRWKKGLGISGWMIILLSSIFRPCRTTHIKCLAQNLPFETATATQRFLTDGVQKRDAIALIMKYYELWMIVLLCYNRLLYCYHIIRCSSLLRPHPEAMFTLGTLRVEFRDAGYMIHREGMKESFVDSPYYNLWFALPDLLFVVLHPSCTWKMLKKHLESIQHIQLHFACMADTGVISCMCAYHCIQSRRSMVPGMSWRAPGFQGVWGNWSAACVRGKLPLLILAAVSCSHL